MTGYLNQLVKCCEAHKTKAFEGFWGKKLSPAITSAMVQRILRLTARIREANMLKLDIKMRRSNKGYYLVVAVALGLALFIHGSVAQAQSSGVYVDSSVLDSLSRGGQPGYGYSPVYPTAAPAYPYPYAGSNQVYGGGAVTVNPVDVALGYNGVPGQYGYGDDVGSRLPPPGMPALKRMVRDVNQRGLSRLPGGQTAAVRTPSAAPKTTAAPAPTAAPVSPAEETAAPAPMDPPRNVAPPPGGVGSGSVGSAPPPTAVAPPAAPTAPASPSTTTAAKPSDKPPVATVSPQGEIQTAAVPVATAQNSVRVIFDNASTNLPASAKATLDEVAKKMIASPNMRLQLLAYSASDGDNASQARRTSLFRAITVRSYLIEKEVLSRRIEVRALGNKFDQAPGDRVDVIMATSAE